MVSIGTVQVWAIVFRPISLYFSAKKLQMPISKKPAMVRQIMVCHLAQLASFTKPYDSRKDTDGRRKENVHRT
jgi:hypothetical protein